MIERQPKHPSIPIQERQHKAETNRKNLKSSSVYGEFEIENDPVFTRQ